MPKYRNNLPQLSNDIFISDAGLETTLVFLDGIDLPERGSELESKSALRFSHGPGIASGPGQSQLS